MYKLLSKVRNQPPNSDVQLDICAVLDEFSENVVVHAKDKKAVERFLRLNRRSRLLHAVNFLSKWTLQSRNPH